MTSKERVEKLLEGNRPDRIAVLPQIGDHAGWVNGLTMDVIYHDAAKTAEAHVKAYDKYRYDIAAVQVEPSWPVAEACGCTVVYPPNKCPWITEKPLKSAGDIDRMKVPDFMAFSGTRTIIEATARLKKAIGKEAIVAGYMTGSLTFALQLVEYSDFILKTKKDPAFIDALVRLAARIAKGFSSALKEAGADLLVVCEHDLQMFSPQAGEKYIVPYLPDLCSVFQHNILHTCGKVETHLTKLADAFCSIPNLSAVTFSNEVSITRMIEAFGDRMGLCGNIDHINLLPSASPADIKAACKTAIGDGMKAKAFMLSPGCEITIDTPVANVKAFVESAALYGRYN